MGTVDVHLFPVGVPGVLLADGAAASFTDPCHSDSPSAALRAVARLHGACGRTSLTSLDSAPPAAVGSLPNPNTEVKLMYADNSSKCRIQCSIYRKR